MSLFLVMDATLAIDRTVYGLCWLRSAGSQLFGNRGDGTADTTTMLTADCLLP